MPFTPSHVLAVLPLAAGRRTGQILVPSALVIGSMVPDLPYFLPPHVGAEWTHAVSGPVTVDLVAGLLLVGLWRLLLRPLVELAPSAVRNRLDPPAPLTGRRWAWAAVSVVIGATTHVCWDTFTHPDRWGTRHIGWLTSMQAGLYGYKWVQYGSGVIGLAVLLIWLVRWLVVTPTRPPSVSSIGARLRIGGWSVVAVAGVAAVLATWVPGALRTGRLVDERVAVSIATRTISCVGAAVVLVCLVCRVVMTSQRSRRGRRIP